ncbi:MULTISPECIES: aminopeptidase P family protein [Muribaculum]|uniref:aminopeptidase P family protein n=7 Tax=Muribaculaceae TaxID=2005473 RepID=UPI000F4A4DE0|nr:MULTISPECIES: aminopeptidase P family protein [Muribaculum]MCX4276423.1 aminopeptidase P family protein [Muribaculum sp.]ROT14350.1 aminopeptidase P family protein [Muribaculaceae bacterium Isolate-102 (HZI)]TGY05963.1 aminopeptidase P family protein [Muribaculum sp. NM65_B17]THG43012.1 aminopeptidase P family protein [Muribaculaceae bacterium]
MFSKETYVNRRAELKKRVGSGLLLFLGNDDCGANYEDNTYPYRQDSSFLYYFGLPYAGLNAIIDIDEDREIIFGDELTIDHIVWMGTQPTIHEKALRIGVGETLPSRNLRDYLDKAVKSGRTIHYLPTYRPEHKLKLWEFLDIKPGTEQPSIPMIRAIVDMRNHKTPEEIAEIERACNVTADMHIEATRVLRPGMREYEVVAALEAVAKANGCGLSFPTIATVCGQTLHNHYHGNIVKPGDMLLVDAGAETEMGYAGDMSSTICADKYFTNRQKEIYDIQVASHLAAVDALKPGVPFKDVYELSARVICQGLKDLGIMKGDPAEAVAAGAHAMFFPCGLGHMMGLDVHDMENLGEVWVGYDGQPKSTQFGRKSLRLARPLEPGFVLTIEPGVYFIPELIDYWKAEKRFEEFINYDKLETYKDFTGIRNEEDYLITEDGARRLGKKIPLTTEEVEALR